MRQDRRGSWYLLTGAVLGVAAGLIYSWLISPVKYVEAPPYALRADYKDDYRALIASAYLYSNDLLRAEERLAQLKDDNPAQALTLQAQQALAEGRPSEEIQALRSLAMALAGDTSMENSDNNPQSLPTDIPTSLVPVSTPSPSQPIIATTTPGEPFVLQETHRVCDASQPNPLIEVEVRDAIGMPVPSVEVLVSWEAGADHFFTGLQPKPGLGHGDFVMLPEVAYSIRLANGGQSVADLTSTKCVVEDGGTYWGSWHLVFVQTR